jgi:hypothetical protein
MIDPGISRNPVGLIRMRNKNGTFIFSEDECERWIELILDRAKKMWIKEKLPAGSGRAVWKPTGRGKLFWVDSAYQRGGRLVPRRHAGGVAGAGRAKTPPPQRGEPTTECGRGGRLPPS